MNEPNHVLLRATTKGEEETQTGQRCIPAICKILLGKALTPPSLKPSSRKHFSTLQFQMKHLLQTLHDSSPVVRKWHPLRHSAPGGEQSRTRSKGGGSMAKALNALQAPFTCEKPMHCCSLARERLPTLYLCLPGCQPGSEGGSKSEPFL